MGCCQESEIYNRAHACRKQSLATIVDWCRHWVIDYNSYMYLTVFSIVHWSVYEARQSLNNSFWKAFIESQCSAFLELLNKGIQVGQTNGNTLPIRAMQKLLSNVDQVGRLCLFRWKSSWKLTQSYLVAQKHYLPTRSWAVKVKVHAKFTPCFAALH